MRINLILVVVSFLVSSFLLVDGFILQPETRKVSISDLESKLTKVKRSSYYNFFIHTSDHYKYEVSEGIYLNLEIGDTAEISTSSILHMPLRISISIDDTKLTSNIGELSAKKSEKIGLMISLALSIAALILYYSQPSKSSSFLIMIQLASFIIMITVSIFVLIELLSM